MFGSDKRVLLRHYLEQGMSKAAIARQLGVSRRTVYYWIQKGQLHRGGQEEPVQYGPRGPGRSKLDPYKAIIDARLAEYPKLTATRLYREVRKAGYGGGYGQVKRYVRQARPRAPEEPVQRFETAPGHQPSVDFADFRLPWGKRYALIVVPGYSRLMWFRYYERQTMPVVMRGLEASFDYFGGVPGELLFDQMKSVIVRDGREEGGRLIENREFVRFSRHSRLSGAGLPTLSSSDEREGGAADPLHPGEFLLGPRLRVGRRSQRPGSKVAGRGGQRPQPRDAQRAARGPVRAGA